MRTANPNRYLDDFQQQVRDGLDQFKRLDGILDESGVQASLLKSVAEDTAFRLGALWEVFQGRWHVAAISRDPAKFVKETSVRLEGALKDDIRNLVLAFSPTLLVVPKRPTIAQIVTALDPKGYNLTFVDAETWMRSSAEYHSDTYQDIVRGIVGDAESASFLDLLKKLRNLLAHGSNGSKAAFNRACRARLGGGREGLTGASNAPLKRGQKNVRDVGVYLRARIGPVNERRIVTLHTRVIEVAEKLRVE
jgi:hypothetical protein